MAETEGVIKFNLTFPTERVKGIDVVELAVWRTVLKDLGLLGQTPADMTVMGLATYRSAVLVGLSFPEPRQESLMP